MTVGIAVNSGMKEKKRELYDTLNKAARIAHDLDLWIEGKPFANMLVQIAIQLTPPAEGKQP